MINEKLLGYIGVLFFGVSTLVCLWLLVSGVIDSISLLGQTGTAKKVDGIGGLLFGPLFWGGATVFNFVLLYDCWGDFRRSN